MKPISIVFALLSFTSSASFALDCSKLNLEGTWKKEQDAFSQEFKSEFYSENGQLKAVDTRAITGCFGPSNITKMYYDIKFDRSNCIVTQTPKKKVSINEDHERVLTFNSAPSSFKILQQKNGKFFIAECLDLKCNEIRYDTMTTYLILSSSDEE